MQEAHETPRKRYIFDISSIIRYVSVHREFSGIQRVVAMLISEFSDALAEHEKSDFFFGFLNRTTGRYECAPLQGIACDIRSAQRLAASSVTGVKSTRSRRRVTAALDAYHARPLKYYFHRTKLDVLYLLGRERRFRRYNMDLAGWRRARWGEKPAQSVEQAPLSGVDAIARPGDVLVLLDSSWTDSVTETFAALKRRDLTVYTMVYDLIPVKLPGYVTQGLTRDFSIWLEKSLQYTDTYITISESVRRDLLDYLQAHGLKREVHALPLVQSFEVKEFAAQAGPLAGSASCAAYPLLRQCLDLSDRLRPLAHSPYVLCVGTIEIRKNPLKLAHAWRLLMQNTQGDLPKLVFAGRMGWMVDDFKDFLKATGNLYGYIEVIEEPTDEELAFLYRNCLFAAMPSLCEGWGLPVGEALSFGKTAIVSNSSSLPEVGGEFVEYCDASKTTSIAEAAWRLLNEPGRRDELEQRIMKADLRTWRDVATDMKQILL